MTASAQSVLLQLLSAVPEGLPVAALIEGSLVLDVSANSARVALTRLKARDLIESSDRGFYRLGPAARAVQEVVAGWRDVEARLETWDRSWIGVHSAGLPKRDRAASRSRRRALRLLGFRELTRDLHVRPNNLRRGVTETRRRLYELGLDPRAIVFRIAELDDTTREEALALWDGDALVAGYRDMTRALLDAERALDAAPLRRAARETFVLGGEAIRQIVSDPLLPEPIVDAAARSELVAAMRRFDVFGRERWRRLLAPAVSTERAHV